MTDAAAAPNMKDLARRMDGALSALKQEFAGLRTGRASSSLVEPIMVEAYGGTSPVSQLGAVGVPDPRTISIQVWDKSLLGAVERAIRDSGLGVNPVVDGDLIRVPIPPLTEERRVEFAKVAGKYSESARVAVRNIRRDGMESIKKYEKTGGVGEDEGKRLAEEIQKLTDQKIKIIDDMLAQKEREIMQV